MNNLQTEKYDHIIIFKDKTKKFITKQVFDFICDLSTSENGTSYFRLEGNLINIYNIAKILTLEEYYSQYPQERATEYKTAKELFPQEGIGIEGIIKNTNDTKHIQSLIEGLKGYINSDRYHGTQSPIELLALIERKLEPIN